MKTAFFSVIAQGAVAIPYRRFGTIYRSQLQGPRSQEKYVKSTSSYLGAQITKFEQI